MQQIIPLSCVGNRVVNDALEVGIDLSDHTPISFCRKIVRKSV